MPISFSEMNKPVKFIFILGALSLLSSMYLYIRGEETYAYIAGFVSGFALITIALSQKSSKTPKH